MQKVSLVLSGGGARGIAHIAAIEEIEKKGFEIHSIVGTSMGALVGAIYATGKLKEFKDWILNIDKLDIFNLMDFTWMDKGFVKGDKIFEELKQFIPDINIEDLKINYIANATDLTNKKEVLFTEGNLTKAIRASVSIPSIFTPVKKENMILVDGGVINNLAIKHAKRIENDLLIAVNVNAEISLKNKEKNTPENNETSEKKNEEQQSFYKSLIQKFNITLDKLFSKTDKDKVGNFDIINSSFEIMRNKMVLSSLENNPPDILIEIPRETCAIFDFYQAEKILKIGKKATLKSLNNYKR